jgi:hypothetical protein
LQSIKFKISGNIIAKWKALIRNEIKVLGVVAVTKTIEMVVAEGGIKIRERKVVEMAVKAETEGVDVVVTKDIITMAVVDEVGDEAAATNKIINIGNEKIFWI